jgi:RNA polymerase sigma-70 factor (ECF subfamily)
METTFAPTATSTLNDELLVARFLAHDESALSELYAQHRPMLMGVIMKVVHDPCEAEDIMQDVLVQLWDHIDSYDPSKGKLGSWIATIARRRAIDHVRKNCAYRRATDRFEIVCEHESQNRRYDDGGAAANDVRNLIDRQLDLLPKAQGEAVRMSFIEGMSQREIAALTHTPLGTVKTRIELGIKKLCHAIGQIREKVM